MRLGCVCLLTNDVVKLSNFYKVLLETDNGSNDDIHQTIIAEETMLTVYNDGSVKKRQQSKHLSCIYCGRYGKGVSKGLGFGRGDH